MIKYHVLTSLSEQLIALIQNIQLKSATTNTENLMSVKNRATGYNEEITAYKAQVLTRNVRI